MKKHNKTKFLANVFGVAFVFFQLFGSTASADYRGYWIDTVRQYQAEQPYGHQPQPAYQDYSIQEPAYQPQYAPESQPHDAAPTPPQASHPLDIGQASYYGNQYNGRPTASGETYDVYAMTAAHRDLPFGTLIRVTNLQNGRSVRVRINDRGPSKPGRIVDVSLTAAEQLGLILNGTADVQVEVLG
ncbi:septal ring lytic transglycosylase RlpA family protein [Thiothrix fructosivorans]|jgi:rare lipoprotein A|uniref:Endolytic peptidoglycan transglycosylase RlpA n=1 Tax=Thiothrix fructosivorans TaxID=111770 RepID=A0A8B0SQ68_9GAMM|nr:septal ring lytic transglycosylase RlpA family protein [Thiothrix fructosivorans]MBO0611375.1 septal ring lytic transglycosylase RlpA family protein [Thiothrix fructosivorans]QTX13054.1 septal ring lytic transglycosylase RlpA family protein [Thiothrix fructosivorans]